MTTLADRLDAILDERDTAEIDAEIDRAEARLVLLRAMRDGLKTLPAPKTRAVKTRPTGPKVSANGKRIGRPPKSAPADMDDLAFRLGVFLKANGPKRSDSIRNHLGIDEVQFAELIKRPWFEKDGSLWTLSSDGFTHFRQDDE